MTPEITSSELDKIKSAEGLFGPFRVVSHMRAASANSFDFSPFRLYLVAHHPTVSYTTNPPPTGDDSHTCRRLTPEKITPRPGRPVHRPLLNSKYPLQHIRTGPPIHRLYSPVVSPVVTPADDQLLLSVTTRSPSSPARCPVLKPSPDCHARQVLSAF